MMLIKGIYSAAISFLVIRKLKRSFLFLLCFPFASILKFLFSKKNFCLMLCMFPLVIVNLIVIVKTELKKGDRSFRLTNGQDLIIKITIKKLIGKTKEKKKKERINLQVIDLCWTKK